MRRSPCFNCLNVGKDKSDCSRQCEELNEFKEHLESGISLESISDLLEKKNASKSRGKSLYRKTSTDFQFD